MKASSAKGTESIFALVNDDVFQNQDEWNSINIIPSFSRKNSIVNTNMSMMLLYEDIDCEFFERATDMNNRNGWECDNGSKCVNYFDN